MKTRGAIKIFRISIWTFFTALIHTALSAQGYYIGENGDTVRCEVLKEYPDKIRIKGETGRDWLYPADIKGYSKQGQVHFVPKKVTNYERKKDSLVFLPNDKQDRQYPYSDGELKMYSGNGLIFYDLVVYGTPRAGGNFPSRPVFLDMYIENDSLGLSMIPYQFEQLDVINAMYNYMNSNTAVEKKLSINEPAKTFSYKGIKKLVSEYIGKPIDN